MKRYRSISFLYVMIHSSQLLCENMASAAGRSLWLRETLSVMRGKAQTPRHVHRPFTIVSPSYRPFHVRSVGFCHKHPSKYSLTPLISLTRGISGVNHVCQNRYDRFRTCLKSELQNNNAKETAQNLMAVAKSTMEVLSSNRRSFHRTWARMSPLLELVVLAYSNGCNDNDRKKASKLSSIADVGCDHGILSLSLASMAYVSSRSTEGGKENNIVHGSFLSRVTGTDISSNALNGALVSWEKINKALSRQYKVRGDKCLSTEFINHLNVLPIDFRVGDGLSPLQPGEADAIILAGMGVHTMIDILTRNNNLDELDTNYLFLQPTNSRPRHLLMLYDALQNGGHRWTLMDERIVFVDGRWYISSSFKRSISVALESNPSCFPGHFLRERTCIDSRSTYASYLNHHINWLKRDHRSRNEKLEREDERWIQYLCCEEDGGYLRDACEWYNTTKPKPKKYHLSKEIALDKDYSCEGSMRE